MPVLKMFNDNRTSSSLLKVNEMKLDKKGKKLITWNQERIKSRNRGKFPFTELLRLNILCSWLN